MHLVSSLKLKALILLPVLLIIFSFGDGDKDIPKLPISENSIDNRAFDNSFFEEGNPIVSTKENTFYIDGEVVDPSVEVSCEGNNFAAPSATQLYMTGGMKLLLKLTITYTYVGNPDPEGTTTFKWFRYDDRLGNGQFEIPGATGPVLNVRGDTYGLPVSDFVAKYLSCEVTPVDNMGVAGIPVEFRPWDIANDNPVLGNVTGCNAPNAQFIGIVPVVNKCSPRDVAITVSNTGINYKVGSTPVTFVDWGDGNIERFDVTLANPVPPLDFVGIKERSDLVNLAGQEWKIIENHTYDYDGASAAPVDGTCTFPVISYFGTKDTGTDATILNCRTADLATSTFAWDDIGNIDLGTHDIDWDNSSAGTDALPVPAETVDVCRGDDSAIRLIDVSTFNCVPTGNGGNEDNNSNDESRWIQWVYGSTNNVTTGAAVNEKIIIFGVSYDDTDLPIYGTPIQIGGPGVTNPPAAVFITDDIQMPVSAGDGQIFEVTIRSWNECNQFSVLDNLNPPQGIGENNFEFNTKSPGNVGTEQAGLNVITGGSVYFANDIPITRTYDIRISPKPANPGISPNVVCNGADLTLTDFQITAAGNVAVEWYEDDGFGAIDFLSLIPNSNGLNSLVLLVADYEGVNGNNPGITNTSAGIYTVWGRYSTNTGTQNCWSDPVATTLTIREELTPAAAITFTNDPADDGNVAVFTVCEGTTGWTFQGFDIPPGALPFGGAWRYNWSVGAGLSITTTSGDTRTITVSHTAGITAQTTYSIQATKIYTSAPTCPETPTSFTLTVDPESESGAIAVAGNVTDICHNTPTGIMTLGSSIGDAIDWEQSIDAAAFTPMGVAGNTLAAQTLSNSTTAAITYRYRVRVKSGVCPEVDNNIFTFIVYPDLGTPVISVAPSNTICEDAAVTLTATNPNAVPGVTYYWFETSTPGVSLGATSTLVLGNVGDSGDYRVRLIEPGNGCESVNSGAETILINPLPTGSVSGGGAVCFPNPAPDVIFTLGGSGVFNLIYAIDGTPQGALNGITSPHNIASPVVGTYTIVSVTDANCTTTAPDANITGTVVVSNVGGIPPTMNSFIPETAVCDDGVGTTTPGAVVEFDLAGDYDIYWTVNGNNRSVLAEPTSLVFPFVITLLTDYAADFSDTPGTYVFTITSVVYQTGCSVTPLAPVNVVINPRPADASGAVNNISCFTGAGVALSVDIPPAGTIIQWYEQSDRSVSASGFGVISGTQNNIFTPTLSTTKTFYAVVESTTIPTLCESINNLAVIQTEDLQPAPANAGVDDRTCEEFYVLSADAPTNGGIGTWTVGSVLYYKNFNSPAEDGLGEIGPATSNPDPTGDWSVSGGSYTHAADWFQIKNQRFEGRDVDNEVVWTSKQIDLTSTAAVDVTMLIGGIGNFEAADYIEVYYRTNLIGETPFDVNSAKSNTDLENLSYTSELNNKAGTADWIEIIVKVLNNAGAEYIYFDDIVVSEAGTGSTISISDVNDPVATVSNLPIGGTDLTWSIQSALGACSVIPETITITREPLPDALDISPIYCEIPAQGSDDYLVTEADMIGYSTSIINGATGVSRTVKYYPSDGDRTAATNEIILVDPATYTVNDNTKFYVRVQSLDTSPFCDSDSEVTFTVNTLPDITDLDDPTTTFCEDLIATTTHAGVNLVTSYNTTAANGIVANRAVSYYTGYTLATHFFSGAITAGGAAGQDQNFTVSDGLTIFARVENTTTGCFDAAQIDFTVNSLPAPNAILDPSLGSSSPINVCKDAVSTLLFQVGLNAGSTYDWTIPANFDIVGGGGLSNGGNATDFFVLLRFPNTTIPAGEAILLVETNTLGCVGTPNSMTIIVEDAPSKPVIGGLTDVCTNQTSVTYTVVPANATSSYLWSIPGDAAIVGPTDGSSISVNFGSASGIISVTETSASGCTGPAADDVTVTAHGRPTMAAGLDDTQCSDDPTGLVFGFTGVPVATSYDIVFVDVPAALTADGLNAATDGNTYDNIVDNFVANDKFTNKTGGSLFVRYQVEPVSTIVIDCNGTPPVDIFIEILPEPIMGLNADLTKTACSDLASGLLMNVLTGSVPATKYEYDLAAAIPIGLTPVSVAVLPSVTVGGEDDDYLQNDIYENVGIVPLLVQYSVRAVSADGCVGDAETINLTVNPEPVGADETVTIQCSGDAVNYNLETNITTLGNTLITGNTYSWIAATHGDVTGESDGAGGTGSIITDALVNTTMAPQTVIYTVIASSSNGCASNSFQIGVPVEPAPEMAQSLTTASTICDGGTVDIDVTTLTTPNTAADIKWSVVISQTGGSGIVTGTGNAFGSLNNQPFLGGSEINGTLTNPGNDAATISYVFTPNLNGVSNCAGVALAAIDVIVEPTPVMAQNLTTASTICDGGTVDIDVTTLTTPNTAADIKWSVVITQTGGAGVVTGTGNALVTAANQAFVVGSEINGTLTNPGNDAATISYVFTPNLNGVSNCAGVALAAIDVVVEPTPVMAQNLTTASTICDGGTVDIDVTTLTTPNTTADIKWSVVITQTGGAGVVTGTGNAITTAANQAFVVGSEINGTLTNPGNDAATISYVFTPNLNGVSNCAGVALAAIDVVVEPTPVMAQNLTTGSTICDGGTVDIDVTTLTTPNTAADIKWSLVITQTGGAGVVTGTGNALVTAANQAFVGGSEINGTLTNPGNDAATIRYVFTPNLNGVSNCAGVALSAIDVVVEPTPVMAQSLTTASTICDGGTVDIDVTTLTTPNTTADIKWSVVITQTGGSGIVTGTGNAFGSLNNQPFLGGSEINGTLTNPGNDAATISYVFTPNLNGVSNCTGVALAAIDVVVEPTPVMAQSLTTASTICDGGTVDIDVTTLTTPNTPADIKWSVVVTQTSGAGVVTGTGNAITTAANQAFVGGSEINGTLTNPGNDAATIRYVFTPNLNGVSNCTGVALAAIDVIVEPSPTMISNLTTASTICDGDGVNIDLTTLTSSNTAADIKWSVVITQTGGTGTVTGTGNAFANSANQVFIGGSEIIGTLSNDGDDAATVEYVFTPNLNGVSNCTGVALVPVVVVVEPIPVMTALLNPANTTICDGDIINIDLVSITTPNTLTDITWSVIVTQTAGSGVVTGAAFGDLANQAFTAGSADLTGELNNSGDDAATVRYVFTPNLSGVSNCAGVAIAPIDIIIEPTPTMGAILTTASTICDGDGVDIALSTLTSSNTAADIKWSLVVTQTGGSGTVTGTGNAFTSSANQIFTGASEIIGTLSNDGDDAATVEYVFTPNLNGVSNCTGVALAPINVIVEPTPTMSANLTTASTICNGDGVDIDLTTLTSPNAAGDIKWSVVVSQTGGTGTVTGTNNAFTNSTNQVFIGGSEIIGTLSNDGDDAATVEYVFTPNLNGVSICAGVALAPVVIIVEPTPTMSANLTTTSTICDGDGVDIDLTTLISSNTAADIKWSLVVSQTGGTGTVTGTGNAFTSSANQGFMGGSEIIGTLSNDGDDAATVEYVFTPNLNGVSNCVGVALAPVEVIVEPTPAMNANLATASTICDGDGVDIELTTITSPNTAGDVKWTLVVSQTGGTGTVTGTGNAFTSIASQVFIGGSEIIGTLSNDGDDAATVEYVFTPNLNGVSNCTGVALAPIVVLVEPTPTMSANLSTTSTICNGDGVDIDLTTLTSSNTAADIKWSLVVSQTSGTGTVTGTGNAFTSSANQVFIGSSEIIGTLSNDGDDVATVEYVFTPNLNGASNCTGVALAPIVVIVEPIPSLTANLNTAAAICDGGLVSISLLSNSTSSVLGALTYGVTVISSTGDLNDISGEEGIDGLIGQVYALGILTTLDNNTAASINVTFRFTPELAGCANGAFQDVIITLDPAPVMTSVTTETICSASSPSINFISDSPATYSWTVTSVTNVTGTTIADTGADLSTETLVNQSGSAGTVTYNVIASGTTGLNCPGPIQVVTITVDPAPVMISANSETICSGNTPSITFSSNVVGSTFDWIVTAMGPNIGGGTFVGNTGINVADFSGELLTNFAPASETITYEVTPTGPVGLGCSGVTQTVIITVDPGPKGFNDVQDACSNTALNYDIQLKNIDDIGSGGNAVAGQFTYVVSELTPLGLTLETDRLAPSTLPINFNYVNTNGSPARIRYTIVPVGFGACTAGTPFTVDFTINPEPVIDPKLETICSGDAITTVVTMANFGVGDVTYAYEVTQITGTVSGVVLNETGITNTMPNTLINTSSAPATVTYTYTVTSSIHSTNCDSQTEDIIITVNPEPVGVPTTLGGVCSDDVVSVNPDSYISNLAGNSFTWNAAYGALTGGAGAGVGIISEVLTNTTNGTINVVYSIIPTSSGGSCAGASFDITVPINPEPVFDSSLTPADVCSDEISGITLVVTGASVPADAYDINQITLDAGLIAGGSNAPVGANQSATALFNDIYTNTTNGQLTVTYKVRPVTAGCKGDEVNVVFKVNPSPAIDPNLDKIVCSNAVSGILLSSTITSAPVANYDLVSVTKEAGLIGTPAAVANGVAATYLGGDSFDNPTNNPLTVVYEVIPNSTAAPSCAGPSEFITLTIEPEVIAAPVNNNPTICSSDLTNIKLESPTNPTAGAISFNVTVSVITGTAYGFIPSLNFLPEGYEIKDNLVNSGNVDAVVEYTITPIASAAATNNGCNGVPSVVNVKVEPLPQVMPGQNIQACSGIALNHTITTSNNLAGTKFKWDLPVPVPGVTGVTGRPMESSAPMTDVLVNSNAFRSTVIYLVTPVGPSANNCEGSPMSINVFVDPIPIGTLSVDQPVVCIGGSALLSFAISVGTAPFEIDFTDGSKIFTVSNIANSHFIALNNLTNTTTYTLKSIKDFYGCVVSPIGEEVTITVENPIANFSIDVDEDCTPLVVTFTNNNIKDGIEYIWNFGDGSAEITTSDATIEHTYVNNSTVSDISFSPLLTAKRTNGTVVCSNRMTDFVTINAGVSVNVVPSITEGCSPLSVNFDNLSQGVLENEWYWRTDDNPGKNEIQDSFLASYTLINSTTSPIDYEIVYIGGRNGCESEVITVITVYPEVTADFTVAPGTTVSITDPSITVTNTTLNNTSWTTLWEWGDGLSTTNVDPGTHTYEVFGSYELKLTVRDPSGVCESVKTEIITVEPVLPIADFEVDITEGCMPLTVQFTNLSQYVDADTYLWTFVDETGRTIGTSTAEAPEFTFFQPGIINVSLEGSNPLGVTDSETKLGLIEIYQLPTASFSVRPDVVFLPDQIMFTSNLSSLADEFIWDFDGDGLEDSEEFEPSFKYSDPGVYDISLIAINSSTGCSDTVILEKAVTVVESGSSEVPNGFFPGSGLGGDGSGGGGGGAGGSNTAFLPRIKGVRDDGFMMQVFDRWGHLLFESNDKSMGWNGRNFNTGNLMPAGVYVYKLELVYISGEQTTIVGDINLIR